MRNKGQRLSLKVKIFGGAVFEFLEFETEWWVWEN